MKRSDRQEVRRALLAASDLLEAQLTSGCQVCAFLAQDAIHAAGWTLNEFWALHDAKVVSRETAR